ncbi:protein of unknown function [Bradyrhizobium vignae]|uniref:Uncharacterized protein n=1 Tax=Bradyrhizobium vignae TaxID=1549949 RepID=A0A2U3QBE1_9BRAD|nr:protein of unknown function [Bradyrhizobium vignae]
MSDLAAVKSRLAAIGFECIHHKQFNGLAWDDPVKTCHAHKSSPACGDWRRDNPARVLVRHRSPRR